MMFSIRPRWLGGAQQASLCEGASGGAIDRSAAVATASSNAMTTIGNAQTRPGRIGGASPAAIEASEFRSETGWDSMVDLRAQPADGESPYRVVIACAGPEGGVMS